MMLRAKYGNKKTSEAGIAFDSLAERDRYRQLCLLVRAGAIQELSVHPRFVLQDGFTRFDGHHVRAIAYVGDFSYTERGRQVVEDVKGAVTKEFALKRKLFWRVYPDIELRIIEA